MRAGSSLAIMCVMVRLASSHWSPALGCHIGQPTDSDEAMGPERVFGLQHRWQTPRYCGVNCLYAFLRLHGVKVSHQQLAAELQPGELGSSLRELVTAANRWGLRAEVVRASPSFFETSFLPVIAHLQRTPSSREPRGVILQGHYVVLVGVRVRPRPGKAFVIDGTTCLYQERDLGRFVRDWSGYLIVARRPAWELVLQWAFIVLLGFAALAACACVLHDRRGRQGVRQCNRA